MKIGVPKEIKPQEFRVGLTPGSAHELIHAGHDVYIETHAGFGIGKTDDDYRNVGCTVVESAEELYSRGELIVKVKEPQQQEGPYLRENHILFTYLHLAPDPTQADMLLQSGASCLAYETVTDAKGNLPLLTPMSEVAGRLSIQAAAHCLEKEIGGSGILLGGVPGVSAAQVVVLGGGVVGLNAARMASGIGARVTIVDKNVEKLKAIDDVYGSSIATLYATKETIAQQIKLADVIVGAVLIPGAATPKLVTRDDLKTMKPGSVLVDVSIDQGGCFETSRPTTHSNPTYIENDIVHYCVANMPGAVPRTASHALTNATLPYVLELANKGIKALHDNPGLLAGLNVAAGKITYEAVAKALGKDFYPAQEVLGKL